MTNYRPWTEAELTRLRADFATTPRAQLAAALNRNPDCINVKARALGLQRPSSDLQGELLAKLQAADHDGLSIQQLSTQTGESWRRVFDALTRLLSAGQAFRHRYIKADLYHATAAACAAAHERLQAARRAELKTKRAAYQRERERLRPKRIRTAAPKPAAKPRKVRQPGRPGTEQIVPLTGTRAPVRVTARGPAYLPGPMEVPAHVEVQRTAPPAVKLELSTENPGFSRQRPGIYGPGQQPRSWAIAAIGARHGA